MGPPSRLAVATSSLQRLLKEESSYHKELSQQEAHIEQLEQEPTGGDENAEFQLNQERKAVQETKNIFPSIRQRISDGATKLEQLLADQHSSDANGSAEEVVKAKDVVAQAKVQK